MGRAEATTDTGALSHILSRRFAKPCSSRQVFIGSVAAPRLRCNLVHRGGQKIIEACLTSDLVSDYPLLDVSRLSCDVAFVDETFWLCNLLNA